MLEDHEHLVAELRREIDVTRERLSQRPTREPWFAHRRSSPSQRPLPARPRNRAPAPDIRLELEAAKKDVEQAARRPRAHARDPAEVAGAARRSAGDRRETHPRAGSRAFRRGAKSHRKRRTPGDPRSHPHADSSRAHGFDAAAPRAPARLSRPRHSPGPRRNRCRPGSSARRNRRPRRTSRSARTTNPMPFGVSRPRAPGFDLAPREPRIPSPPPEELRAALHPPATPLPPARIMTPAPVTPRGPEARLVEPAVPSAPPERRPRRTSRASVPPAATR